MSSMTLGQFAVWYRLCRTGDEKRQRIHHDPVKVLSPEDLPVPADAINLPTELRLESGFVLQKLTKPRILSWGPRNDNFGQLMLFQVLFIFMNFSFATMPY